MALHPLLDHPALRHLREDVTLLDAEGRILGTTMEHDVTIGYAPDVWRNTPFFRFLDPRDETRDPSQLERLRHDTRSLPNL